MSLTVVATPIGNLKDITVAALECLKAADLIVGEERSEASRLLKALGIEGKKIELLNEHSTEADVKELVKFCNDQNVVLISDCGTPGFCDPGHQLVKACRNRHIKISTRPGASSLMSLLSLSSERLNSFVFVGFLPADKEKRNLELRNLKNESRPIILMETPYRLKRWIEEIASALPNRRGLLALNITQEDEWTKETVLSDLPALLPLEKAEPILLIYSNKDQSFKPKTINTENAKNPRYNNSETKKAWTKNRPNFKKLKK